MLSGPFRVLRAFLILFVASTTLVDAQSRYIAFGDSLTDPGNLFVATGGASPSPSSYYQGHFSNGLTWFEQAFGVQQKYFGFSASAPGNVDFAFGGARTDNNILQGSSVLPFGLQSQIASYLARSGTFSANDTVALWAGANNLFNAFDSTISGYTTPTATSLAGVMASAALDMRTAVSALVANGARKILIFNLPDVGNSPSFLGTAGQAGATYASQVFNQQLAAQMATIKAANPSVSIVQVDIYSLFSLVSANPSAFGFANANAQCLTTTSCVTATKAVQNTYAFWDGVHPTESGHALIAQVAQQYLFVDTYSAGLERLADHTLSTRQEAATRSLARFDEIRRGARNADAPYVELIGSRMSGNYSQSAVGLAAGIHHRINPTSDVIFEAFVQGGSWKAGRFESDAIDGGLAGAYQFTQDKYFMRGSVGVGFSNFLNVERKTVATLNNTFDQTSMNGHALVEAGLAYGVGNVTLSPRARFGWLVANFDAVTETGTVAPLQLSAHTASTLTSGLELQASTNVAINETRKVAVTATLGYERWFGTSNYSFDAALVNNTALPFKVGSSNPTGPGVLVGLGLNGKLSEKANFTVSYRASLGTHSTRQDLRAGTDMPF